LFGVFLQIAWNEIPKALDNLFYALEPLVSGILLTNIFQWSYAKASSGRSGTHWQKWGPVYLIGIATVFSMAMPLAVLFIYVGEVGYPESKMWKGSWFPNTPHGAILYALKWIGMVCLTVGMLQLTGLHIKIRKKWAQIRNGDAAKGQTVTVRPADETCATGG